MGVRRVYDGCTKGGRGAVSMCRLVVDRSHKMIEHTNNQWCRTELDFWPIKSNACLKKTFRFKLHLIIISSSSQTCNYFSSSLILPKSPRVLFSIFNQETTNYGSCWLLAAVLLSLLMYLVDHFLLIHSSFVTLIWIGRPRIKRG